MKFQKPGRHLIVFDRQERMVKASSSTKMKRTTKTKKENKIMLEQKGRSLVHVQTSYKKDKERRKDTRGAKNKTGGPYVARPPPPRRPTMARALSQRSILVVQIK